jgi:membrane protein
MQVQSALNKIWDVEARPRRTKILEFVRHRLLSFGMLLAVGFLLVVSLILSAALSALIRWLHGSEVVVATIWLFLDPVVSWLIVSVLFAAMFKFLPDVKIAWRHVVFGACVTGGLFTAGKYVISAYLAEGFVGSTFGAAGSIVVLTVWVYYAALILYLGAEITHVRAERLGVRKVPEEFAVSKTRFPTTGLEHSHEVARLTRQELLP